MVRMGRDFAWGHIFSTSKYSQDVLSYVAEGIGIKDSTKKGDHFTIQSCELFQHNFDDSDVGKTTGHPSRLL